MFAIKSNDECLNKATNVNGLQKPGISTQIYTRLKKLVYFLVTVYDKYVLYALSACFPTDLSTQIKNFINIHRYLLSALKFIVAMAKLNF